MKTFVITFYTHFSAMVTQRNMKSAGISETELMPVPRSVSSSCGTCLKLINDDYCPEYLDEDTEAVYEETDGKYKLIYSSEE